MLSILDRYLLKESLWNWLAVTLVLWAIVMSNSLARFLADAVDGDIPGSIIFTLLGLKSVSYLTTLIPLSLFLGVLLALGRFYQDSEMVAMQAENLGDRPAIVDGAVELSFSELAAKVDLSARALIAMGIEKGDRIAVWAPNMWEWVVAALAIHGVGAVMVPVNTRYKGIEAAYLLEKSGARALFTVTGFLDVDYVALLRATNADLPALSEIVVLRGEPPEGTVGFEAFLARASEVGEGAAAERAASIAPDDLADILFTSGTTGKPKGAMCTHAQNLRVFDQWSSIVGLREGDRYLIVLPFFHSFGYKAGWFSALMRGATIFPEAVFDVNVVLRRIQADQITMLPGPPALYQSLLLHPSRGDFDIASLRLAVTGAAASRPRRRLNFMRPTAERS